MSVLATIGSTSPFVGLFGTVWGIMNSFIGISKIADHQPRRGGARASPRRCSRPAIGLAAAIPAVIIYNHFNRAHRAAISIWSIARPAPSAGCCRAISTASAPARMRRAAE